MRKTRMAPSYRPRRVDELTREQKKIYDMLPEGARELLLRELPAIPMLPDVIRQKRMQRVREELSKVDYAIATLQAHKRELERLAKSTEDGDRTDFRGVFVLPKNGPYMVKITKNVEPSERKPRGKQAKATAAAG